MVRIKRPYPLFVAPMLDIWRQYEGREYTVFVDESFNRFLRMTVEDSRYGYFSYGCVGVPTDEYSSLRIAIAPILGDYLRVVGGRESEFKHTKFKRIPFNERSAFSARLARALAQHGAFVSGFYRPAKSFVMEQVRDAVMFEEQLPDDVSALYREAVGDIRKNYYSGHDKSELLAALLLLPVSACGHMLAAFDCPFRVVYDGRERREDLSVKERIEAYREVMEKMSPQLRGLFRGLEVSPNSKQEPGLQLADLVAGETHEFLEAFPEMMSHGATRRIISQGSRERLEAWDIMEIDGTPPMPYKVGAMTKMPRGMIAKFVTPDESGRTVLSHFSSLLVSGTLTCYSTTGNPRHVMPFLKSVLDQCDR